MAFSSSERLTMDCCLDLFLNDVEDCPGRKSPSVIMALWWEKETRIGAWDIIKSKGCRNGAIPRKSLSIPKRTGSGTISAFNNMVY